MFLMRKKRKEMYLYQMRVDERFFNIVEDGMSAQGYGEREMSKFVRDAVIAKATNGVIQKYHRHQPLRKRKPLR